MKRLIKQGGDHQVKYSNHKHGGDSHCGHLDTVLAAYSMPGLHVRSACTVSPLVRTLCKGNPVALLAKYKKCCKLQLLSIQKLKFCFAVEENDCDQAG